MRTIKPGSYVARESYGRDVVFVVKEIWTHESGTRMALLAAVDYRLLANAPLDDLRLITAKRLKSVMEASETQGRSRLDCCLGARARGVAGNSRPDGEGSNIRYAEIPGSVLHLDGDESYLQQCMRHYEQLGIKATGIFVPEQKQADQVVRLLKKHIPDFLVLTGHDGLSKKSSPDDLAAYYNSRHFVQAVEKARAFRPEKDGLIIFAGACQSYFEAIMAAGANYASSPGRKLIHCYDPVFVAEKVSFTPLGEVAGINDVVRNTITGPEGIGGIETRGLFRLGMPAGR